MNDSTRSPQKDNQNPFMRFKELIAGASDDSSSETSQQESRSSQSSFRPTGPTPLQLMGGRTLGRGCPADD
ncbi:hypothetical protein H7X65_00590 [Candidatus Parcubacteria bacterium]|nr:hypothetical protein [Candidatus Parcubacteria bacterium]